MAEKNTTENTVVSVSYSVDDGVEQFAIRSKGKSRRVIVMDRDQALAIYHEIGRFLAFEPGPVQHVEPVLRD